MLTDTLWEHALIMQLIDTLPDAVTKLTSHDPNHPPPQTQKEFPGGLWGCCTAYHCFC